MPLRNQISAPMSAPTTAARCVAGLLLAAGLSAAQAEGLYVGGSVGTPRFGNSINGIGQGADNHEAPATSSGWASTSTATSAWKAASSAWAR